MLTDAWFEYFQFQGGQSTLENCQVLQVNVLSPFSIYDYQIYMESFCSVLQYCVLFIPGFANLAVCCYMFALLNITIKYFSVHQTDGVGYLSFFVFVRFMKIESRWTYFYSNLIIKVNTQNQLCPRCQILCRVCKYY